MLDPNLTNRQRRDLARILSNGLECSEHHMVGGGKGPYYINLDRIFVDPKDVRQILTIILSSLSIHVRKEDITKLVFIDSGELGARGMLQMRTQLGMELELPTILCQIGRRIARARIVGDLCPLDRIAIVTDIITTGRNVAEACAICRSTGAEVVSVFSVFDRQEVAEQELARLGIKYSYSGLRLKEWQEQFSDEIQDAGYRERLKTYSPPITSRDLVVDAVDRLYS